MLLTTNEIEHLTEKIMFCINPKTDIDLNLSLKEDLINIIIEFLENEDNLE